MSQLPLHPANGSGLPSRSANAGQNTPLALDPVSNPIFLAAPTFPAGYKPMGIAVADLNRDGRPDLAVANLIDASGDNGLVSILLANGDGTYQDPVGYLAGGGSARSLAVSDFNHDGYADLVVGPGVTILLGSGDGTLRAPVSYESGVTGYGCLPSDDPTEDIYGACMKFPVIADFNGDAQDDIAVSGSQGVGVLLGHGDGTFSPVQIFPAGYGYSVDLAAGDLNRDGRLDLAVANACLDNSCLAGSAVVLLGNGDGTFQPAVNYSSGAQTAVSIAIGDLDGDRIPDLVVANMGTPDNSYPGTMSVLLGNGDGTFAKAVVYPTLSGVDTRPRAVAIADFNRDGKPDISVLHRCLTFCGGTVSIFVGNGNGSFRTPPNMYDPGGYNAVGFAVADLDLDGNTDVAVVSMYSARGVSVLMGNGDGTLQAAPRFGTGGAVPDFLAVSDLNLDGKVDLVVSNSLSYACNYGGSIAILLGNGKGGFQLARNHCLGGGVVTTGDFNGDGKPDLALRMYPGVGVLLGDGKGGYQLQYVYPLSGYLYSITTADFNVDGKLDMVIAPGIGLSASTAVFSGNGDGTFQPPVDHGLGVSPFQVEAADLDGNGKPDLVVTNPLQVMLGNGDGTFQPAVQYPTSGQLVRGPFVGDLNGDAIADLAVSRGHQTDLLFGLGDGTFLPVGTYPIYGDPIAADFNGDGTVDLVLVGLGTTFLAGTGNGVFSISSSYGPEGASVQTVDFNGDGKPDLAFVAPYDGAVTLLLNTAKGFRYVTSTSLSSSANPVKVGKPVTFTVLVRPAFPGLVTGSVTFHDGALALATVPVHERGASFSTARLSVGTHTIVAVYSGDGSFLPSTSTPLQQAVVDLTPPIITISAQPSILWPPDGRMVPVLVSGTIRDLGSGVLVNSVEYAVTDEYGKVQPAGHMALDSAGKYTFTVLLPASRLDNDNNGRRYMIRVSASDNAGNRGASWKVVTVPHDQR